MKLTPGQLTLTREQRLFYWRKALRAVLDFYIGGQRYHGYSVEIRDGDLWARPIGGHAKENLNFHGRMLGTGFCPVTAGGADIYADIPARVSLALYRNNKRAQTAKA